MTRPGTQIIPRDAAPSRTAATDTGTWFAVGLTEKGSTSEPILVESPQAFVEKCGGRVSYSSLYDAVETFFRNGGRRAYIARVVGPAAAQASVNLQDDASGTSLIVRAKSAGEWGNKLNVEVKAGSTGGTFVLEVSHDDDGLLEVSPDLADQAAAIAWSESSPYVTITAGASSQNPAVAAAASLTGGSDDRAAITDQHKVDALARFRPDLGPGQVSVPGSTSSTIRAALAAHAKANNRRAIADLSDTANVGTLESEVGAVRSLSDKELARYIAFFAPWIKIPGVVANTTRTVPPCAAVAGTIGRSDAATRNPNVAAAGDNGRLRGVVALTQAPWTDADRKELNEAGVNVIREVDGEPRIYGFRTAARREDHPLHWQLANVRLDMAIAARADAIAERYVFRPIDGQGHTIAQFNGELAAMLSDYHALGALHGATADEAFRVDTGADVNTPESIANGELRAVLAIRRSPFAELVIVEIVKTAITEAV